MTKFKTWLAIAIAALLVIAAAAYIYFEKNAALPVEPGTKITVWYAADDDAWKSFESFVAEYNDENAEEISVSTRAFSDAAELAEALESAKNSDALPNIVVCDTDTSAMLCDSGLAADMDGLFGAWSRSDYVRSYVEMSKADGQLVAVPVAATTELMMVNTKLYGTDEELAKLESFEDICEISARYYEENESGFFTVSDYAALFRTMLAQRGDTFDAVSPHNTDNENSRYVYSLLAEAAYGRGFVVNTGSAAELVAEGSLPCAITTTVDIMSSSADAGNTEFFAYPLLEDGESVCLYSVRGMTVCAADENSVNASAMFIRWFTSAAVNSRFVSCTGYLPAASGAAADTSSALCKKLMAAVDDLGRSCKTMEYAADADYADASRKFNSVLESIMDSLD